MDVEKKYNMKFIWSICLIAAMGGLLFGYDWVVIGGAKPFFIQYFGLQDNPVMVGWAMSSALIGCLVGSIISGMLSDKFGRKRLLVLAAFIFFFSAIGTGLAGTFSIFVIYRLLGGTAIGLASNLSPMYIAEVTPANMRGKFVATNQLTIVIGILAAQVVNWAIARNMPANFTDQEILASWYGKVGWRWMFAAAAIPSFVFFVLMFIVPESPRWLIKNGKDKLAEKVLDSIGGPQYAAAEVADIKGTLANEIGRVNFKDLFEPKMLKIISIGVVLAAFQQWCGINVIFYYAEDVFKAAGYSISAIMLNIVVTGIVFLVFTFVAIAEVDRLGRKLLMLIGSAGLVIIYAMIGLCYHLHSQGLHVLILTLAAIACYAFSLAPIVWVLLSELFPNRIRGAAMSISVFTLWLTCWALAQAFPIMIEKLGAAGSFWTFGVICFAGFIYTLKVLPETKCKTLEEIERELVGYKMHEQLKQSVCEANLQLQKHRLVIFSWGNVSAIDRDAGVVAIKPSGVSYDSLTPDKIVLLDLNGKILEGSLNPSSDTPTHLELYRNFKTIGSICHTHSTFATMWAQGCREIPCLGTTHADYFYGSVPVTKPMTKSQIETDYELNTGKVIVERFASLDPLQNRAVLVANHGPFTWGKTAAESVEAAVVLEEVAKMAYGTIAINPEQKEISQMLLDKHYLRKHGKNAYYGQKE